MTRYYEVTECEHGLVEPHTRYQSKPLEAGDWGMAGGVSNASFLECPGGVRRELTIDYEAACEYFDNELRELVVAAVDAALGDS